MARKVARKGEAVRSRYIAIGRIYKGSPKGTSSKGTFKGGDDYASAYFRFEPSDRFKAFPATSAEFDSLHAELAAKWEELITRNGGVRIVFPHPTIEENFSYENVVTKVVKGPRGEVPKVFRRCDGTTCTKWVENRKNPRKPGTTYPAFVQGAKPCSADPETGICPEGCAPSGFLNFMAPELYMGGIIEFPMHSIIDLTSIEGYLEPFRNIDLRQIPFFLFRKPDTVSWIVDGETQSKVNWAFHLEPDPEIASLMAAARQRQFAANLRQGGPLHLEGVYKGTGNQLALGAAPEALPRFEHSDDGLEFTAAIAEAIRQSDLSILDEAVSASLDLIAGGLYDPSGAAYVEMAEERARGTIEAAISTAKTPVPRRTTAPKASPAPTPAPAPTKTSKKEKGVFADRLALFKSMSGVTPAQINEISKAAKIDLIEATRSSEAYQTLRRGMMVFAALKDNPILADTDLNGEFDALAEAVGANGGETETIAEIQTLLDRWGIFLGLERERLNPHPQLSQALKDGAAPEAVTIDATVVPEEGEW